MTTNYFLKELIRAFLIGTLIFLSFLSYYYFADYVRFENMYDDFWKEYFSNLVFSTILYMVNMIWFRFILKKWDGFLYTFQRMSIALIGNVVITCIGIFVATFIILIAFHEYSFQRAIAYQSLENYLQSVIIAMVVACIFYIVWYYKYRQENKVKEQKIIAGTASAKFDALKNQLDPHFLFNSLNVLTSLIEEDPYQAQKFTTSLSKVYRYVLEQKNKDLISVDEELKFAKTYVRLLKMRFEDSIVFEIPEQSSSPEAKIIPLSLQLLLENAVKHNVVTSEKPLHIKVLERDGMLEVSNNLQEKQVVKKSSGVGLTNIQQRYAILTDRRVRIEKTASDFSVQLPMLTKQVSKVETQEIYIEDKRYEKAKEQVEKIKGFYGNLTSYLIVIPILIFINFRTTSFPWAIFPALGWGFGLTAHGLEAFGYNPLYGKKWEERKMREFMEDENF
ncbi:histidine kinase [Maribacter algarum]|uniref:Histidine kinase n=1 Tax=Maribacter algarum (ex Zhang et al. 2020) TaxID=2578118 RepID=A0A5S3PQ98_9FLAO|nr:2TM domain-containing protein [Maribacter algarum]TMM56864.1 histidine kinase [Maribacter algarum]